MVVAHDCRLIMGPGRQGEVFGIVAMVPDGNYIAQNIVGYCTRLLTTHRANERGSECKPVLGFKGKPGEIAGDFL